MGYGAERGSGKQVAADHPRKSWRDTQHATSPGIRKALRKQLLFEQLADSERDVVPWMCYVLSKPTFLSPSIAAAERPVLPLMTKENYTRTEDLGHTADRGIDEEIAAANLPGKSLRDTLHTAPPEIPHRRMFRRP